MVGYDGWTPNACSMHVAIEDPIAVRRLIKPAFGIVFDEKPKGLGLGVALASVLSTNTQSLRFTKHLGFKRVAMLRDAWRPGVHMIFFELRRDEWLRRRGKYA